MIRILYQFFSILLIFFLGDANNTRAAGAVEIGRAPGGAVNSQVAGVAGDTRRAGATDRRAAPSNTFNQVIFSYE
jgi:hypothetical protein